ncbi:NAD(P)/FAD-dependent oxidoreductase [Granulicoccus sp. GXG6511]|uniref:NAD(P)/FAD-dependent oxidoreductase n=1 Tax=Granulicoccus sp. GXG6511 TaxID=3381351 RepID=UPI003D7D75F7
MTDTIIIVGAGQAGGWAAATLRKEGYAGRVVLIGDEPHVPYERPPLSKAVLKGEAEPQHTHLMPADKFAELDLDFRSGVRVTAIDPTHHEVEVAGGERIAYDKLILAMGGAARSLPIPGGDLDGVLTLRTLADAQLLKDRLTEHAKIVVVGGGWIGLEVAATARQAGADVVVVEAMPRLCQRSVPEVISDYLKRLHEGHGVEVRLGSGVQQIERSGDGLRVELNDGTWLEADTVVAGIGLTPHLELAEAAGLELDGGIVVGPDTRTSDPDIFAAGDVAVADNPWVGGRIRLESWQNAQDQGIAAAKAALGQDVTHEPLPWFWSDQYDVNLQLYGIAKPEHTEVVRGNPENGDFLVFFLDGDRMVASMGPNGGRDLRMTKRIIERGITVDPATLADPEIALPKR